MNLKVGGEGSMHWKVGGGGGQSNTVKTLKFEKCGGVGVHDFQLLWWRRPCLEYVG